MSVQDESLIQTAMRALGANRLTQAKMACDELLRRNPREPRALDLRGRVAFAYGFYDEAASYLERATAILPRDPSGHLMLAQIRATQGAFRESLASYDRVLRRARTEPRAIAGKANVLQQSGEPDRAAALLAPFLADGSESDEMAVVQARLLLREGRSDDAVTLLRRHLDAGEAEGHTLQHLQVQLGKSLEMRGDYDDAFAAYAGANAVVRSPFDLDSWRRHTDELIAAFSAEQMASLPRGAENVEQPVFIVGMPRSGSTLIESIIDAHPRARGIGECSAMQEIVNDINLTVGLIEPYPRCIGSLEREDLDDLGARYLERARQVDPGADRLADKYLINYRHLGLIALLFPRCRVIHARRDPLDTCISCFVEPLPPVAHPYAADLGDLGRVYRDYERFMRHWRAVLELEWLDVAYETLVSDQEGESRRLIDFLGLEWDERCLRFYETGRTFHTLSYDQVRRPVYRTSVRRAEHFEPHLQPLREALHEPQKDDR